MLKNKALKAFSTIEYSLLIAIIVAALVGMQVYLRRAVCERYRQTGDTFGFGRQFQP